MQSFGRKCWCPPPASDCIVGTKLMGVLRWYFHDDVLRFSPVAVQSVDGDSIGGLHVRRPSGIVMRAAEFFRLFFIFEKSRKVASAT